MKKYCCLFLLGILFLGSCQKKLEPIDEYGSPAFSLRGEIDGKFVSLEAGVNSFFLQTEYGLDSNKLVEFKGNFKQTCSHCKQAFKVIIKDYQTYQNGQSTLADSSLPNRNYDFYRAGAFNIPSYGVVFSATPQGSGALKSQVWEFSDGSSFTNSVVSKTFRTGTSQELKYTCNYLNGCSSSIQYKLKLNPFLNPGLLPDFSMESIEPTKVMYKFTAGGDSTGAYYWSFGDGGYAKGKTVYYGYDSSAVYLVSLFQITATDTFEISKNLNIGFSGDCSANFTKNIQPNIDPMNKTTVNIEWTDEQGEVYSSSRFKQKFYCNFTLDKSEDYLKNKAGQKTRLLNFHLNCLLSNGLKTIEIRNLEGKMAVALP